MDDIIGYLNKIIIVSIIIWIGNKWGWVAAFGWTSFILFPLYLWSDSAQKLGDIDVFYILIILLIGCGILYKIFY